jgi:WD40 repeat protein
VSEIETSVDGPDQWLPRYKGGLRVLTWWTEVDGRVLLASGGTDGTIRIWDPEVGVSVGSPIAAHTGTVSSLGRYQLSNGAWLIVSGGTDSHVRVWDPLDGCLVNDITTGPLNSAMAVAGFFSSDGSTLIAAGTYEGVIQLTRFGRELETGRLRGHAGAVVSFASWPNADGHTMLASGSDDGTVRVWDLETQTLACGPFEAVAAIEDLYVWSSPQGRIRLSGACEDGAIYTWDPETGTLVGDLMRASPGGVWALSGWQTPNGETVLAAGAGDGTITFWNAASGENAGEVLQGPWGPAKTLGIWQTGDGAMRLACAGTNGVIQVSDPSTKVLLHTIPTGHISTVYALASWQQAEGEPRLASVGTDSVLRVWNPESGSLVREMSTNHTAGVWALCSTSHCTERPLVIVGGLDGALTVWDADSGTRTSPLIPAHTASVAGLTCWREADGTSYCASSGDDALIRIWDLETGAAIGQPLRGHSAGVLNVVSWVDDAGRRVLASCSGDGSILTWDPYTGIQIGDPLFEHPVGIWAMGCWRQSDGSLRLASGDYDGSIRIWDPLSGTMIGGEPLASLPGAVRAFAHWRGADDVSRLAAAVGTNVYIFSGEYELRMEYVLEAHAAVVRALATWQSPDGSTRLASAGDDGAVCLWDPESGTRLRTIEVGPIQLWGLSDAPVGRDLLGRESLVDAIVDQLSPPSPAAGSGDGGPTVVTIEGPWGCGKSTLMKLIEQRLRSDHGIVPATPSSVRHLTVREAMRDLRGSTNRRIPRTEVGHEPSPKQRAVATGWFNPWAHESGEQIWAGLMSAILEAIGPVLFSTDEERERYWFTHNLPQLDRHGTRRALRRRVVSPLLGVALAAVVVPATLALAQLGSTFHLLGHSITALTAALLLPLAALVAGFVHTAMRYYRGWATDYLPSEIFGGPIGGAASEESIKLGVRADGDRDPINSARVGALYFHQRNLSLLLADTAATGHELVLFIDDLDRCRASTTAEVFEAINLFLVGLGSREGLRTHFVMGLDPVVVAEHLDRYQQSISSSQDVQFGDDPSSGWAYLRKLIQLPVVVPQISRAALDHFIEVTTQAAPTLGERLTASPTFQSGGVDPLREAARTAEHVEPAARRQRTAEAEKASTSSIPPKRSPKGPQVLPWRAVERHPEILALLRERLASQPNQSIREAKRLINVWQLYERMLAKSAPLQDAAAILARSRNVLLLAETVTRWPALQHYLYRRFGDSSGLRLLVDAANDEAAWLDVISRLEINPVKHRSALRNLRELIRAHNGHAVADLAEAIM